MSYQYWNTEVTIGISTILSTDMDFEVKIINPPKLLGLKICKYFAAVC